MISFSKMDSQLYIANFPFELSPGEIAAVLAEWFECPTKVVCLKRGPPTRLRTQLAFVHWPQGRAPTPAEVTGWLPDSLSRAPRQLTWPWTERRLWRPPWVRGSKTNFYGQWLVLNVPFRDAAALLNTGLLKGQQPYLGDLFNMVMNHLLTRMILQAGYQSQMKVYRDSRS